MYRQSFKTPEKSISPLQAQIFLPKSLVKISFSAKDFQRHRQACTISSLSSIIEIRLAMTPKPDNQYLVRRFYEWKTSFLCLKKLVWRKLLQIIWVLRKKKFGQALHLSTAKNATSTQQMQQEYQVRQRCISFNIHK